MRAILFTLVIVLVLTCIHAEESRIAVPMSTYDIGEGEMIKSSYQEENPKTLIDILGENKEFLILLVLLVSVVGFFSLLKRILYPPLDEQTRVHDTLKGRIKIMMREGYNLNQIIEELREEGIDRNDVMNIFNRM